MIIAIPKEIKDDEYRVALSPDDVAKLSLAGHQVIVEAGAGDGVDFSDADYRCAKATILSDKVVLFAKADMIVKVKEPQLSECRLLKAGQILFAYLHLGANREITRLLLKSQAVCIAYESVGSGHNLPLLKPMSEIAGKIAVQFGACALARTQGGLGVLLSSISGVKAARVLILGGGVVGRNAAKIAAAMGANVIVLDRRLPSTLIALQKKYTNLKVRLFKQNILFRQLAAADLVIGAVSIPAEKAPKVITRAMLQVMKKRAVIVDVAIDQGGCCETSHPTTHSKPSFISDGIVHFCITNMPSAAAKTATSALAKKTLPFILTIANQGYRQAMLTNPNLANGLQILAGKITHKAVAKTLNMPYYEPILSEN